MRLRLYLVADYTGRTPERVVEAVRAGLEGGVTAVQYRDKSGLDLQGRLGRAEQLGDVVRASGALFIVNDDLAVALASNADGVHLGPLDRPLDDARRLAPPPFVIGASVGTAAEARERELDGASYLGFGALYDARATKPNASPPRGLEALSRVVAATRVPVVAIGGLSLENTAAAIAAGAAGVAVVRALLEADEVGAAARRLRAEVERALRQRGETR